MKTLKVVLLVAATALILLLTPRTAAAQSPCGDLIYQTGINSDGPPGAPDGDCSESLPIIGSIVASALAVGLVLLLAVASFAAGGDVADAGRVSEMSSNRSSSRRQREVSPDQGNAAGGSNHILGSNGPQIFSKTVWKGKGKARIDVENPNPGKRAGQVHYQDNENNKYLFNPVTKKFINAPNKVDKLLKDAQFRKAVEKAMKQHLGESDFSW